MGRIVVTEFITLDGVAEDLGGAEGLAGGGWSFKFDRGKEGDQFKYDEVFASDAHLLGRNTYQAFGEAWPSPRCASSARSLPARPSSSPSSAATTPPGHRAAPSS